MTEAKQPWYKRFLNWLSPAIKVSLEFVETSLVVLYVVNGVTTFLVLFDFVPASTTFKRLVGSLAFGFSMFAFVAFINKGVKHQNGAKKGKK